MAAGVCYMLEPYGAADVPTMGAYLEGALADYKAGRTVTLVF